MRTRQNVTVRTSITDSDDQDIQVVGVRSPDDPETRTDPAYPGEWEEVQGWVKKRGGHESKIDLDEMGLGEEAVAALDAELKEMNACGPDEESGADYARTGGRI